MRLMKTVPVPASTREEVDKVICDFCGDVIVNMNQGLPCTTLEHDTGFRYPECGWGTKVVFDCCPKCWEEKVLPAFRGLGAEPRVEEWDY